MRDRTWRHSRRTDRPRLGRLAALILALCLPFARAEASPLKADEEVILFPTVAHLSADAKHWRVPIHAWVFEPECDSLLRNGLLAAAAAALGLEPTAVESAVLEQRLAWFLVDNEGGKRIDLTLSPESRNIGPTGANGHLLSEIELEPRGGETAWLEYAVDPPQGDRRVFTGQTLLLPDEGLSVVSDIDDTVKVSHVADKKALLENTFLKPFLPAPGMAALYRAMARKGAAFHYVSSSPWQLYPPFESSSNRSTCLRGPFTWATSASRTRASSISSSPPARQNPRPSKRSWRRFPKESSF